MLVVTKYEELKRFKIKRAPKTPGGAQEIRVKNIQAENQNRVPRSEELKNFKGKRVLRTKKITTHAFESGVLVEVL